LEDSVDLAELHRLLLSILPLFREDVVSNSNGMSKCVGEVLIAIVGLVHVLDGFSWVVHEKARNSISGPYLGTIGEGRIDSNRVAKWFIVILGKDRTRPKGCPRRKLGRPLKASSILGE
jgi:hypothetical protein